MLKTEKSKSRAFLGHLHNNLKEEVLLECIRTQVSNAPSQSQNIHGCASHIETLHDALHVLTGGTISSTMTGTVRPGTLSSHNALLYFNLFKGLSDGVLSVDDFRSSRESDKILTVKSLLDGDPDFMKDFVTRKSIAIDCEGGEFRKYCEDVSASSKDYVKKAFDWLNAHVIAGDIDSTDYIKGMTKAEEVDKENLTPLQKIYLSSNTKSLVESRGLKSTTSDDVTSHSTDTQSPRPASATSLSATSKIVGSQL